MNRLKSKIMTLAMARLFVLVLLSLLLPLTSCGDDEGSSSKSESAKSSKKEAKKGKGEEEKKEAVKEAPVVPVAEPVPFSYDPAGKRDPFRSFISADLPVIAESGPLTPLERFEINQYKLVAIIIGDGQEPTAMVEDPEGVGHFLRKDTVIGKTRRGTVAKITASEVVLSHQMVDIEGKTTRETSTISLPADDEIK